MLTGRVAILVLAGFLTLAFVAGGVGMAAAPEEDAAAEMLSRLDAPLLFAKRHSYTGIHIYDIFYKWPPGGGGIYVIEDPSAPRPEWVIRPVIDPTTPETLGVGVYSDPELSWDAKRLLFTFKGEPEGSTSIYEIGLEGKGLRRVTDPTPTCACYQGSKGGQHDISPAYLPDGRIIFLSTRKSGLVPCANSGVAILHVMNADGSDIHAISANNVNEFDPAILPDGRVLAGRWEYVDKNALTIQSLWTIHPDGTEETALFANNMVFPEALLDARPVPDSQLIVATLAKHNSTPRGAIGLIDPRLGKNGPKPITNLEHPEDPTFDRGDSCEPWPIAEDLVLFSGRREGEKRNVLEMIDRAGRRVVVHSDPEICLHSPMLVKPRPLPAAIPDSIDRTKRTGRFFVQDIYRGLPGVEPGEVKSLRVIEETSRTSGTTMGGSPYNQTFLVSAALAFSAKNYLGMVPVEEDGSAYFEVPVGRAVYLQALDADGRLVQSMRTFVQAAPGVTRSCIGCHEHKQTTSRVATAMPNLLGREPAQLEPESWGSGYVDYASMVQPVLDRRCVRCHGGEEGIAAGMDLSGGWTEHFNISYENLANRRETQLVAHWIAGIDCMNGTAFWSSQLFPPRAHGSGAAPLAELLVDGHDGYVSDLTRTERDLLLAWIDSNGVYHGTWDSTESGCAIGGWNGAKGALVAEMKEAGCLECHGAGEKVAYFENDWINLRDPELSRILRAPLGEGSEGYGLGLCRRRKVDPKRQRIHMLWRGYAHAVQPIEAFAAQPVVPRDASGEAAVSFSSTADPHYQAMLAIIRGARRGALAQPRIDMPGAKVIPGTCRMLVPPPVPDEAPALEAAADASGVVHLAWERSARTIGLASELHRSDREGFALEESTLLMRGPWFRHTDEDAPVGKQHYALVTFSADRRSRASYAAVDVPPPAPPPAPEGLAVAPASCAVRLEWQPGEALVAGYHVFRAESGGTEFARINSEPVGLCWYADTKVEIGASYRYVVRAVSRRGAVSAPTPAVEAVAEIVREPVFSAAFDGEPVGQLHGGPTLSGKRHGAARCEGGVLNLAKGGHVTFPHDGRFDLTQPISIECWVWFDAPGKMPVVFSAGHWRQAGWFLQSIGGRWRWHVGGVDCDGGAPGVGRWIHVAATYDGSTLKLYEDGKQVAEQTGSFSTAPWPGELFVGQYSGTPGAEFQVTGRMRGVKVFHRPLEAGEIAEAAHARPE